MKYRMKAWVINPNPRRSIFTEAVYILHCDFEYERGQYGNGFSVRIWGDDFNELVYDLRYDKSFDINNKKRWLEDWAKTYWSGVNGAWKLYELIVDKQ